MFLGQKDKGLVLLMAFLVHRITSGRTQSIQLPEATEAQPFPRFLIGSGPTCDIRIVTYDTVLDVHASLFLDKEGEWWLREEATSRVQPKVAKKFPTRVNGERLLACLGDGEQRLKHQDCLEIGEKKFLFVRTGAVPLRKRSRNFRKPTAAQQIVTRRITQKRKSEVNNE